MSTNTKIEWTQGDDGTPGATWNPVTGCTKVSPGCDHCYAETFAERWRGVPGHHFENGFDVTLRPERLEQPHRWRKPRRIFVNSMSDLFHEAVPTEFIAQVFATMAACPQHTFQLLTKRHGRMRALLNAPEFQGMVSGLSSAMASDYGPDNPPIRNPRNLGRWPLPNVHLGISAEDYKWASIRSEALLDTPAAVRFVSAEPLLGPIGMRASLLVGAALEPKNGINWVIVGGESGPGARPMDLGWVRDIIAQCRDTGTAVFVKQLGSVWARQNGGHSKGGDWDRWPEDLRVREFPAVAEGIAA